MLIKEIILSLSILLITVCGVKANFVDKSSQKIRACSANIEFSSLNMKNLNENDRIIASDSILYTNEIDEEQMEFTDTFGDIRNIIATISEIY